MGQRDPSGPGGGLDGDAVVSSRAEHKVKRPQLYQVLLHNDDYTTMEFVVMILVDIFHHEQDAAVRIMLDVHRRGIGVAGVYTYEVAETKIHRATTLARQSEFPLRCTMEPL